MQLTGNSQIRTIIALQFGAALGLGLLLLLFGKTHAWSGFVGGMIAALANGYFSLRSFVQYRAQEPEQIARRMLGAEIQKLLLIGLMFVLAIRYITPLSMGALLGSYLIVQVVVPLVVTLIHDRQHV
ncbi:MAG: ATP synthase subunit I [Candidatus Thiodiazotropha sp.]|jgi:ATP synthase protein I